MKLESVGYRYSQEDLAALMALSGARAIPGLPLEAPDRASLADAVVRFEKRNIATVVGGKIAVERVPLFLMRQLASCADYLCVRAGDAFAALYRCKKLDILLFRGVAGWTVQPVAPTASPEAHLRRLFGRIGAEAAAELCVGGVLKKETYPAGERGALLLLYQALPPREPAK